MKGERKQEIAIRAGAQWERLVFAEVLVPESPNTYNDFWTKEGIRDAAYAFMKMGFGVDVNHDNIDRISSIQMVESFIARDGDPDFIPGSWVVGMYVGDDAVWQQILDGDINGYSYEAIVEFLTAIFEGDEAGTIVGVTEADPADGHTHDYAVHVNGASQVIGGGTATTNGHWHPIITHTVTEEAAGHIHRYNLLSGAYLD